MFLIFLCLFDSLFNIYVDPDRFDSLTLCEIAGTLKLPAGLGIETTQLSLLLITYFSFNHSYCIDNHSKLFKLIIFYNVFFL